MDLSLQPDLCSLLIEDVIYHEAAVRQAGAEALSQVVARYQRQAAEVMGRLMEIYQEKLYVSSWAPSVVGFLREHPALQAFIYLPLCCSARLQCWML